MNFSNDTWYQIRPEIRALCERGNITLEEYKNLTGNSWEWAAIHRALNHEAFIHAAEHSINNCFFDKTIPYRSYNESVMGFFAPELLARFREAIEKLAELDRMGEKLLSK